MGVLAIMGRKAFSFFLVCLISCVPMSADYASKRIQGVNIFVEGVDSVEKELESNVSKSLKTKEGGFFSHADFDDDLKKLYEDYYEVDSVIKENSDGSLLVEIKLVVAPVVENVYWKGAKYYSLSSLKKILAIKSGQKFNRKEFYKHLESLRQHYVKNGFFESRVTHELDISEDKKTINVTVKIREGLCGKIKKIIWKGASKDEISFMRDLVHTNSYNLFTSWLTGAGFLNSKMLELDKAQILNFLQNEGYCDAVVEMNIDQFNDSRFVVLTVDIKKGDCYHFGAVSVKGSKEFEAENLEKSLIAKEGNVFSTEDIHDSMKQIQNAYASKGFVDVKVTPLTVPSDVDHKIFDVCFEIEEGESSTVGLIHIRGNRHTKPNIVLNKIFFRPGDMMNSNLVNYSADYLRSTGLFKSVNVTIIPKDQVSLNEEEASDEIILEETEESVEKAESNHKADLVVSNSPMDTVERNSPEMLSTLQQRDVYIDLEEEKTFNFKFGLTFAQTQRMLGSIEMQERNFNIAGLRKALITGDLSNLRGNGEIFGLNLSLGKAQTVFSMNWDSSSFLDSPWGLSFGGGYNSSNAQNKALDIVVAYGSVGTRYALSNKWAVGLSYKVSDISTRPIGRFSTFTDVRDETAETVGFLAGIVNPYKIIHLTPNINVTGNTLLGMARDVALQRLMNIDPTANEDDLITRVNEINQRVQLRASNLRLLEGTLFKIKNQMATSGLMSAPSMVLRYRSVDHLIKPHSGVSSNTVLSYAGLGGNFDFWKFETQNMFYLPLWQRGTVIFRFSCGSIFGRDAQGGSLSTTEGASDSEETYNNLKESFNSRERADNESVAGLLGNSDDLNQLLQNQRQSVATGTSIPLSERFYSGGETSVRGYAPLRIGPINAENGEAAGGYSYGLLSLEYRQDLLNQVDMFYFIDTAFVSQYSVPESNDLKLWRSPGMNKADSAFRQRGFKSSIGVGLYLYMTPGAPMSIGYGKVLNPAREEDAYGVFFSMGVNI